MKLGWISTGTLALALAFPLSAFAADAVTVENAWARASATGAGNGAAFMTLTNPTAQADTLTSASADVAMSVELHTHLHDNGVMRMRKVDSIPVPANGSTSLKPAGYHVMLLGLNAPLKEGQSFPLTLTFKNAGAVQTSVKILGVGAMGPATPAAGDMKK